MTEQLSQRPIGVEARKSHQARLASGFIAKYLSGEHILDIGYRGYEDNVLPVVAQAIGVDLDYPGYDGRTLPFPEGSQDAVFASHCLEHIPDFANALRDWFRVLRVGGFIVVMVPHQFLYEKKVALPSNWNADHKRFYTPARLMLDVESALTPNSYRLRHLADNDTEYEYDIGPGRHAGGCYEIELVIEKIRTPAWALDHPAPGHGDISGLPKIPVKRIIPQRKAGAGRTTVTTADGHDLVLYDFASGLPTRKRILVLKLDHFGDFVIGLPALGQLRAAFPEDHLCLVCGPWNRQAAEECGLVDEIRTYTFFPENSLGWTGKPVESVETFAELVAGHWEIAVDLRVDDDTRILLPHIDADLRCGIGSSGRMPFLDVALPPKDGDRANPNPAKQPETVLAPNMFHSRMPHRDAFCQYTDFGESNGHLVYGPYVTLPVGKLRVAFAIELDALPLMAARLQLTFDIVDDTLNVVAATTLSAAKLAGQALRHVLLEFENADPEKRYEFRIYALRRPIRARLRFFGVSVEHVEATPLPRLRRAELHIGEQLSLLVRLLADRTRPVYDALGKRLAPSNDSDPLDLDTIPANVTRIVISPVGNSDLRNWPLANYTALVRELLTRLDCVVLLTGSRAQSGEIAAIVRDSGDPARVIDLAGRTAWSDLPDILRRADLVICNNSGVAHLAAACGVRTLAIYSASHQPQEWGPRGAQARALMAVVPCSPCGYDRIADCPNDHACMAFIKPDVVADLAVSFLADGPARQPETAGVPSAGVPSAGATAAP